MSKSQTQDGRITPQLDQQSTKELNLTVLRRIDACVEEILSTAAHVAFYEFNNEWSRKDVEGTLFVVKRRAQPRFQFIVMNRRSTENLVEDLLGDFEYEVQVPYIFYRNAAQEVNGIWFYDERECAKVAKLFNRILNAFSNVPPKLKAFTNQSSEFQELEAVSTLATIDSSLEPTVSASSIVAEVPEESLERFFGTASHLKNPPYHLSSIPKQPSRATHPFPTHPMPVISSVPNPLSVRSFPPESSLVPLGSMLPPTSYASETNTSSQSTLVKPSFFVQLPLSSQTLPMHISVPPRIPPLIPPVSLQPSLGARLLQPFPPPAPSPSLAATSTISHRPLISRDSVRAGLLRLVQNEHFIDMVYREMTNQHPL